MLDDLVIENEIDESVMSELRTKFTPTQYTGCIIH